MTKDARWVGALTYPLLRGKREDLRHLRWRTEPPPLEPRRDRRLHQLGPDALEAGGGHPQVEGETTAFLRDSQSQFRAAWVGISVPALWGRDPTVNQSRGQVCYLDTLATWLESGEAAQEGFGTATSTRPRPRRHSCASRPAGSARGFCGIWATGVRLVNALLMRQTPHSHEHPVHRPPGN